MKVFIIFWISCLILSCDSNKIDDGYYLKKDYLEYLDSISQKSFELNETEILLKISNDTIYHWGDIKYWSEYYVKQKFPFKKINDKGKIKYFLEIEFNGSKESFEYFKIDSIAPPLDSLGLDFSKLGKLKSDKILKGDYILNNKKISFKKMVL